MSRRSWFSTYTRYAVPPNVNNALGSLLQDMLPRGQVRSENTQAISGQPGLRPDVIITVLGLIDNYALQVTAAASCSAARKYRLLRS